MWWSFQNVRKSNHLAIHLKLIQLYTSTMEAVTDFILGGLQNHCGWGLQQWNSKTLVPWKESHEIKRHLLFGRKTMTNVDNILKSREITLLTNVYIVKAMVLFSSHVQIWELDHEEGWVLKNWCFRIVVLEKTLESPLDCKNIKPVNP